MRPHAKLSASGAHRWLECPGSIGLEQEFPNTTSIHAAEGTAAHDVAEQCLRGGTNVDAYLGELIVVEEYGVRHEFEVDDAMVAHVQLYLDYCRDLLGERFIEKRVDFSPWVPGGFGTSDFTAAADGLCTVVDLKYGTGVKVQAANNPQAMLYALGALNELDFIYEFERFKLVIVQPRLDHIDEWELSRLELLEFAQLAKEKAADALGPAPKLAPSEKACRFCKAKGVCRALAERSYASAVDGFSSIETADIRTQQKRFDTLEDVEIAKILHDVELHEAWLKSVKSGAIARLLAGGEIPGFKLVEGASRRKWSDEVAAGKALARKLTVKEAYVRKTIGISAAEKLLGKDHPLIEKHVTKPAGRPTLAVETSSKPAITIDLTEGFTQTQAA